MGYKTSDVEYVPGSTSESRFLSHHGPLVKGDHLFDQHHPRLDGSYLQRMEVPEARCERTVTAQRQKCLNVNGCYVTNRQLISEAGVDSDFQPAVREGPLLKSAPIGDLLLYEMLVAATTGIDSTFAGEQNLSHSTQDLFPLIVAQSSSANQHNVDVL